MLRPIYNLDGIARRTHDVPLTELPCLTVGMESEFIVWVVLIEPIEYLGEQMPGFFLGDETEAH